MLVGGVFSPYTSPYPDKARDTDLHTSQILWLLLSVQQVAPCLFPSIPVCITLGKCPLKRCFMQKPFALLFLQSSLIILRPRDQSWGWARRRTWLSQSFLGHYTAFQTSLLKWSFAFPPSHISAEQWVEVAGPAGLDMEVSWVLRPATCPSPGSTDGHCCSLQCFCDPAAKP